MKTKTTPALFTLLMLTAAALTSARAQTLLQPNDVVAICGDSITQQKIYSVFIEDYLLMCQPAKDVRVVQFGWGGEKSDGFHARIVSDVLPFKPTVATICYGMNDGGYKPLTPEIGDAYRKNMTAVVESLKAHGVRAIVVGSPGAVDPAKFGKVTLRVATPADVYNQNLAGLRDIAKDVAAKEGVAFADIHTVMMDAMQKAKAAYGADYLIANDGIHPGGNGHIAMAYAFLKGLGCDGNIGTITVDMAADKAEGTDGQQIVSCKKGVVQVESTRYPYCFKDDPAHIGHASDMIKFIPFNEDLNRYLLVVKGLTGSKAKVTWGTDTKEFSAADLAKGINLAAEFPNSPFQDQFEKVSAAVGAQQIYETTLVQNILHEIPVMERTIPKDAQKLDAAVQTFVDYDEGLYEAAKALVVPVQHTITIVPEA